MKKDKDYDENIIDFHTRERFIRKEDTPEEKSRETKVDPNSIKIVKRVLRALKNGEITHVGIFGWVEKNKRFFRSVSGPIHEDLKESAGKFVTGSVLLKELAESYLLELEQGEDEIQDQQEV